MEKKIFLSIETSLNRIYLVLINDNQLFFLEKKISKSIEVDLNVLLENLLNKAKINFNQLDGILVSLGPGSFTGTRVGLSAAKAISVSLNIEIYGYSNFYSIIQQADCKGVLFPGMDIDIIIQATKSDFYYQKYSVDKCEFGKMKIIGVEDRKSVV